MAPSSTSKLLFCILASLFLVTSAQNCSHYTFPANRIFTTCKVLPFLEANLHWSYNSSSTKVSIAYRAKQDPKGWVAWAINPTRQGMVGSQALVAFHKSNDSMIAYTTQITSYSPSMLEANLSFQVSNISAEYLNNEMIIFATIGPLGNGTTVNHVWQGGNSVANDIPQMHPLSSPHLQSFGEIDFQKL
ncbi:cytochrome b561 and DOMON domain-containing protein At5g47530-like [Solanum dulcamara]|uniref:cytochrome b561 and DOMON domain-containing protein At5g47530-like n=1 Tax=Solanum dulcamara TaxID=45834 RepID=UPI0024853970|nr:cytochrome b561 and DOMON domain-containing protein At5g47530-like [Solanum dulcamara]